VRRRCRRAVRDRVSREVGTAVVVGTASPAVVVVAGRRRSRRGGGIGGGKATVVVTSGTVPAGCRWCTGSCHPLPPRRSRTTRRSTTPRTARRRCRRSTPHRQRTHGQPRPR
jgi:hypothetical protein